MSRILVVDDDLALCEALSDLLTAEGWEVTCAGDGCEALAALGRARFDAILLDFMMPVMNGAEFRGAQLARPELAGIPVILASAACADRHVAVIHPDAVLAKPFDPEQLLRCLEDVVRRSEPDPGPPLPPRPGS